MDNRKIDAALAIALASGMAPDQPVLEVFIQLERSPTEDEAAMLHRLGLLVPSRGTILTGRVSAQAVAELSRQAWVRQIRLSQRLRPLDGEPE